MPAVRVMFVLCFVYGYVSDKQRVYVCRCAFKKRTKTAPVAPCLAAFMRGDTCAHTSTKVHDTRNERPWRTRAASS